MPRSYNNTITANKRIRKETKMRRRETKKTHPNTKTKSRIHQEQIYCL